jgi:protein gp37
MGVAHRFGGHGRPYEGLTRVIGGRGQWNGNVKLVPELLDQPIRWRWPRRIFVNSMSDLFHDGVPDSFIDQVFAVMALCPHHIFQVLTKRPERMLKWFQREDLYERVLCQADKLRGSHPGKRLGEVGVSHPANMPLRNLWLGVSVENQAAADERVPLLLQTPAAVRFLSCEPLLGQIDLTNLDPDGAFRPYGAHGWSAIWKGTHIGRPWIDWVIVGGESGQRARPMHPDWARSLRDQCHHANVPFFYKQWGAWVPIDSGMRGELGGDIRRGTVRTVKPTGQTFGRFQHGDAMMRRVGKHRAGRLLDGVEHKAFPKVA